MTLPDEEVHLASLPAVVPDELEVALLALMDSGEVKIPPYPAVALKLNQVLARPAFGLSDIISVLSSDQSLVASVLRSANSAYFNRGEVTSLQQAVLRVGADEVGRLALVASLASQLKVPGSLQSLKQQVWEGAVASASICQVLAKKRGLHHEDAFVAGLLHDFGWMVGISALESIIEGRKETLARTAEQWSSMLERLHVRLGLDVAERWNLPTLLYGVMAEHHVPGAAQGDHAALVELVHASDAVVEMLTGQSHVSALDLARVRQLRPGEAELVAAALPGLPSLISSFNPEGIAGARPRSMLIQPATTLPEGSRPIEARVQALKPRPKGPFTMIGIASQGWTMRGLQPLQELELLEAEIMPPEQPPLRIWAKTTLCTELSGSWQLECKPFALSGPALNRWNDLFRNTPRV
ncbi:MAG TPA: HDOD domain-containing protein [Myxococcales bacterium]|nr:HDOD domain-containing protein [Myxococcales bacterium]